MINAQKVTRAIMVAPQAMTNTATVTANLDTKGHDYATIPIAFASEINTNAVGPTIALTESDDTVVTNFATFDADFARSAEDITAAKAVVYHVDCRARKRYLRLSVTTATATNDNVTLGVVSALSRSELPPSGTTGQGDVVVIG